MTGGRSGGPGARRWPLVVILVLGVGLVAAPVAFRMFSRAPQGGTMIDEFRPFMTEQTITDFRGYLDEIGAARDETATDLQPALGSEQQFATDYPQAAAFVEQWGGIDADMSDMLDTIDANRDEFDGVSSLPPFALFPWFFVIPGVLLVVFAGVSLARAGSGRRPLTTPLVVLGVGLLLAPAMFQMFTRAPGGGAMIDDFESLMTRERVTTMQGYFITIGAGEGQLRTAVVPAVVDQQGGTAADHPATAQLSDDWPQLLSDMSEMVGAMADNLDNYAAVAAMPPFPLFPWFFVVPGVAVIALALVARRPRPLNGAPELAADPDADAADDAAADPDPDHAAGPTPVPVADQDADPSPAPSPAPPVPLEDQ